MSYSISELHSDIDSDEVNAIYIFASKAGCKAPIGMLRLDLDEPTGWIGSLLIVAKHRNKGVGTLLLNKAFEISKSLNKLTVGLTYKNSNEGAKRLYERLGFIDFTKGHEGYTQMVKVL